MTDEATLLATASEKLDAYTAAKAVFAGASVELAQARANLEAHQQATAELLEQMSSVLAEEAEVVEEAKPRKRRAPRKAAEVKPELTPAAEEASEPEAASDAQPSTPDEQDLPEDPVSEELDLDDWQVGEPEPEVQDEKEEHTRKADESSGDPADFDHIEF